MIIIFWKINRRIVCVLWLSVTEIIISKGTKGGEVMQYGTVVLANEGGKYDQILNYYYSGSKYSSRNLNFFGYNLGY